MLEVNCKQLAIITVYRIVDTNTKSVDSTKVQYERKTGKVKREKETLTKLKEEIREIKVDDVLVVGDMNEDINSKSIHEFMVELGLYDIFGEVNEVEDKKEKLHASMDQSALILY